MSKIEVKRIREWYNFDLIYSCGHKENVSTRIKPDIESLYEKAENSKCESCTSPNIEDTET